MTFRIPANKTTLSFPTHLYDIPPTDNSIYVHAALVRGANKTIYLGYSVNG